jgi:hypothetical protein
MAATGSDRDAAQDERRELAEDMRAAAEKALKMKTESDAANAKPDDRTAHDGLHPIENRDQAPSGALDHGGALPAMQRSKFAR